MIQVTTRHNGSQRVTNLAKTYINTASQGFTACHQLQILMAGVAQEPCDPSHNGSQWVTSLTKTYINTVSLGHKAPHRSQILLAGVAQKPCDPSHSWSQRDITGHKPSGTLHKDGLTGSQTCIKSETSMAGVAQDRSFSTFFSACLLQFETKCLRTKFYLCCGLC